MVHDAVESVDKKVVNPQEQVTSLTLSGGAENNLQSQAGRYSSTNPHLLPLLTTRISTKLSPSPFRHTRLH
jgi:hypothetical protein